MIVSKRDYRKALAYSRRWLDTISQASLSSDDARAIIEETCDNFALDIKPSSCPVYQIQVHVRRQSFGYAAET